MKEKTWDKPKVKKRWKVLLAVVILMGLSLGYFYFNPISNISMDIVRKVNASDINYSQPRNFTNAIGVKINYTRNVFSLEERVCRKVVESNNSYSIYGISCILNNFTDYDSDCICYRLVYE